MTDPRYETIQKLLKAGGIKKFTDIFVWIPHTALAKEYRTNNNRMKKMVADPSLWKLQDLYKLADLVGYDAKKIALMALQEVEERMNDHIVDPNKKPE